VTRVAGRCSGSAGARTCTIDVAGDSKCSSLVYARTKQNDTLMTYQRTGDITTYEWSVKPFDRFPDRPAHLFPGKRIGLEVAVVDKDANTTKNSVPPAFLTWGLPPTIFKGSDASTLGELILAGPSEP
jgi:hypothetical protein